MTDLLSLINKLLAKDKLNFYIIYSEFIKSLNNLKIFQTLIDNIIVIKKQ